MSKVESPDDDVEIVVEKEGDWFVATDTASGVASQGETRPEALENLAEALRAHEEPLPPGVEAEEPDTPWF